MHGAHLVHQDLLSPTPYPGQCDQQSVIFVSSVNRLSRLAGLNKEGVADKALGGNGKAGPAEPAKRLGP